MRGERGFTLVEVLIVSLVLTAGTLGFLQTTLLSARVQARSRAVAAAAFLAQERLERAAALGWERATAGLERAAMPELLETGEALPREEVTRAGARFLVAYERDASLPGPPRCAVHCLWAVAGGGFERRNAVTLAVRRP